MNKLMIVLAMICGMCLSAFAQTAAPATQPSPDKLILLVGQSNMAGRGTVTPRDEQTHPRILMFNKDMAWVPAKDPVHFDKNIAGVGLCSEFARTLAAREPDAVIGLIPCAVGGTSLDQWKKGDKLYTNAITRARAAMKNGQLAAILWHQGEADASPEKSATYPERFIAMMSAMRQELHADNVPVVIGEIGYFNPRHKVINENLAKIPSQLALCALVTAEDLKDRGDKLHFDTPSLYVLGKRYADAYYKLTGKADSAGK